MPTPTYVAIAKTVLTGTQSTVTFSGIVNTYTDLVLVLSARSNVAGYDDSMYLTINGSSSYTYSYTYLSGNSSSVVSGNGSGVNTGLIGQISGASATANTFGSVEIYIPNYLSANNKVLSSTGVAENNSATANQSRIEAYANLWRENSAITSISLQAISGSFVSGSRFDLYGIKNS